MWKLKIRFPSHSFSSAAAMSWFAHRLPANSPVQNIDEVLRVWTKDSRRFSVSVAKHVSQAEVQAKNISA